MSNPLSQIFRFILKLVFAVSAAVLAISVLVAALIALALSVLAALLTGRKPAPAMAFARFREFSQPGTRPAGRFTRAAQTAPASSRAAAGQVVDVEVREIAVDRRNA